MRLDDAITESTALEDAAVGVAVLVVTNIETGFIEIERVRVLHHKLPHSQQSGAGPRFVAELALDLVPHLRQLFVAAQLVAGDGSYYFFVAHAEAHIPAPAVLEARYVAPHSLPAS